MKLRSTTEWRSPRTGRKRRIRLYGAWMNLNGRILGHQHSHGTSYWKGLESDFYTWQEFRSWALRNGYSKLNNSLDRIDPTRGYLRDNLCWLPFDVHRQLTHFGKGPIAARSETYARPADDDSTACPF